MLNLAYNALLGGQRLEDIELRRNDEAFLDGLGAQRIPDPTTSGDFTRRFDQDAVLALMEALNTVRQRVWKLQPTGFLEQAFIDTDGTIAPTFGECKGGMALFLERPLGLCAPDRLVGQYRRGALSGQPAGQCRQPPRLRPLDRSGHRVGAPPCRGDHLALRTPILPCAANWIALEEQGIKFIFGLDAHAKGVALAEALPPEAWQPLERLPR